MAKYRKRFRHSSKIIDTYGLICVYCNDRKANTVDHFVPWSVSHDNSAPNIVICCRRCNGIANDKVFESYEAKRLYILDRLAVKLRLQEVYCPKGCGVTYARRGQPHRCPDCGELV